MPIRLAGMASGLDTDSLIKGMVDAQRLKNKKVSDKSQILDWQKEKLKDLNSKLYKLYTEDLTKLRLQGNYSTKKVTSSNDSLVEVKAGSNAPTGTVELIINQTATSQSVISGKFGNNVTSSTLLKDLYPAGSTLGSVVIANGSKETVFSISDTTTIGDFVNACKGAGLNANFDNNQKKLFISSKNSGVSNQFSIREYSGTSNTYLADIKKAVGFSSMNGSEQETVLNMLDIVRNGTDAEKDNAIGLLKDLAEANTKSSFKSSILNSSISKIKEQIGAELLATKSDITKTEFEALGNEYDSIRSELLVINSAYTDDEIYDKGLELYKRNLIVKDALRNSIPSNVTAPGDYVPKDSNAVTEDEIKADYINHLVEEKYSVLVAKDKIGLFNKEVDARYTSTALENGVTLAEKYKALVDADYSTQMDAKVAGVESALVTNLEDYRTAEGATSTTSILSGLNLEEITGVSVTNSSSGMTVNKAMDAELTYNGVKINSSSNTVDVNGYTLTLKGQSTEKITISTTNDTQGTFDAIKKFVTNYNAILKELNTLYYADSARGYAPLSDDEREAMTDSQIEKWETKIKDSMLRRDSNIGKILTTMKTSLSESVVASDGKKYSLASFGIGTSSDYTEKGLLHINGDPDDAAFSNLTNKLMKALESDPDIVSEVLSKTFSNLYTQIDKSMKAIPNVRSAFTFYNDKTMTTQQTEYKKKISTLESKLTDLENKYYKQFAAMEKAMATLQSQSNALAGMLGTGGN